MSLLSHLHRRTTHLWPYGGNGIAIIHSLPRLCSTRHAAAWETRLCAQCHIKPVSGMKSRGSPLRRLRPLYEPRMEHVLLDSLSTLLRWSTSWRSVSGIRCSAGSSRSQKLCSDNIRSSVLTMHWLFFLSPVRINSHLRL